MFQHHSFIGLFDIFFDFYMTFMNLNCNVFASYFAIIHLWAI